MRTAFFLAAFALVTPHIQAQDMNAMMPRELVIIHSTKDYTAALKTARDAARRLSYPLDLDGNRPHKTEGLTNSPEDCDASGWSYPCYKPRGYGSPADNPRFVSIEWSTVYEGFSPGYYIVVVADGQPGSADLRGGLAQAKKHYASAYAKETKVWYGCMH